MRCKSEDVKKVGCAMVTMENQKVKHVHQQMMTGASNDSNPKQKSNLIDVDEICSGFVTPNTNLEAFCRRFEAGAKEEWELPPSPLWSDSAFGEHNISGMPDGEWADEMCAERMSDLSALLDDPRPCDVDVFSPNGKLAGRRRCSYLELLVKAKREQCLGSSGGRRLARRKCTRAEHMEACGCVLVMDR